MGRKEALFSAEVFIWGGKKWVSPSFLLLFEELQTSEDCFESLSWAVPTWPVVLDPFILWLRPLWRFAWLRSCHILLVAIYRLEPTRKQLLEVTGPWEWPWQDVPCLDRGTWTPLESGCPDFLSSSSADLAVSFLWGDGSWLLTSSATCGPARHLRPPEQAPPVQSGLFFLHPMESPRRQWEGARPVCLQANGTLFSVCGPRVPFHNILTHFLKGA